MNKFHILCLAYHKLNGVHHCFIMKVKEVLNRLFHVYVLNVTMTACVTTFLPYFIVLSPNGLKKNETTKH